MSGRADVSGFFNTQMVLDLNGKYPPLTLPHSPLHLNITTGNQIILLCFCARHLQSARLAGLLLRFHSSSLGRVCGSGG